MIVPAGNYGVTSTILQLYDLVRQLADQQEIVLNCPQGLGRDARNKLERDRVQALAKADALAERYAARGPKHQG